MGLTYSNKLTAGKLKNGKKFGKSKLVISKSKSINSIKEGFMTLTIEQVESSRSSAYSYIV
jgi:hypothetical protein